MLARLSQASLAAALQRLSPAISSKPAVPVLGGIRLRADADGFAMTAGSGGVAIETRLDSASGDAVIQRAGQIVIPSRRLLPLVRCLPEGAVSLEASNGPKLTIRAGNACYRLSGMDADLYPDVETPRPAQSLRLPNRALKQLVKRIAFAAADSEARPVLTGICCSIRADGIAFTATDGVRLSSQRLGLASTSLPEAASDGRTAVIPAKRLLEFAGTLSDEGFTALILGEQRTVAHGRHVAPAAASGRRLSRIGAHCRP